VPDWNSETYRIVLRCLSRGQIVAGGELAALKNQLVNSFSLDAALLCGSGSLALELALRACDVRAGDEVVLPTFCCTAVVPPILAVGATPVLADVGAELNVTVETVQAALTQKTRAVIVPHLFGNPAEIDRIVELVRGRNIAIIDDAAQALGATIGGRAVGSFGDFGVLSFGAEKICAGLGGGVVISKRPELAAKFAQVELAPPACLAPLAKVFSLFIGTFGRNWIGSTKPGWPRESAAPDAMPSPYRRELMSHLAAAVAASLVRKLADNLTARRARQRAYRELLEDCPGVELIAHRAGSACLSQVIRVRPRRRGEDTAARLINELYSDGYPARGSYMPIHLLSSFNRCVWDRVPNADRLWADLVELPCEPKLSLAEVARIGALVRRAVER
jgi:dTDP-4-amino-4,6-dideoxygalactose transaminase